MFEEEKIEQRILYNNNDLEITKYTEEEKNSISNINEDDP